MSDITVPPAFLRDEPAEQFAARIAALADRLERIEKEFGAQLNPDGKKLLRRAVFATRLDRQRRVWVDGDPDAV